MHISIPKFKLPHFSISGEFNPLKGKLPHIGVKWYANGGLLDEVTLLGMSGNTAHIAGEAGPEMVMPLSQSKASRAWQLLGQAVERINKSQTNQLMPVASSDNSAILARMDQMMKLMANMMVSIQVDLDGEALAQRQAPKIKRFIENQDRFNNYWKTV